MIKPFEFGSKKIGRGQPVYIISEIGINHEGSVEACAKMIEETAKTGANAIKLQTCSAVENYVPGTESFELFSKSELTREETAQMFEYARQFGLDPFTTSPDPETLAWVDALKPAGHKISSGMMTNPVIIRKICETQRPVLMSTGLASQEQVDESMEWIREFGDIRQTGLFQCTSIYPAPPETLNLGVIIGMERRYNVNVGFSDHTDGIEASALSVYAGAVIIEKHFTMDRRRTGFDHILSLETKEFTEMVRGIRKAEIVMGSSEKHVSGALADNAKKLLRTLVARQDIEKGAVFTEQNVTLKRPLPDQRGLDPKYYYEILGKTTRADIGENVSIQMEHIKDD